MVKSVSIVIPVYNEEQSLPLFYEELRVIADRMTSVAFEIMIVDDGSMDKSPDILRDLCRRDARVKGVVFQRNYGQTAAMSCGIKMATGEVIIPMDADLQNDPADIPKFLEKIDEGFSCVSGWRKDRKDAFFSRKLPSWIANTLISWMTGVSLHDYGCTMKAYKCDVIQGIELYGEMHRFIPAYAAWTGAKVTEIAVNHRERSYGVSKYGLSRVFKVLLDLIVVRFLTTSFNKPMHFFGVVGFIALLIGSIAEIAAIVLRFRGLHLVQTPLPVVGAMFVIVGVQFLLFGLLAEVMMRTYYESKHATPYHVRETMNV
ncbi:MAG TPA: glycosyltransferase family 2 protein [Candidatus Methylomirabilis sp.]|nr:glycosyltransferase family 2 protein [Candidatus Methylomirabilis sp.]